MDYPALLNMLRGHPTSFLRSHYLKISVPENALAGPTQYYLGGQSDGGPGGGVMRWGGGRFTRGSKELYFKPANLRFQLAPQNVEANVWVIPTHFSTTVHNYAAMNAVPVMGGVDIMVTTLLNGCTFCCANRQGGGVLMKHIQPKNGLNGTTLAQAVQANGGFFNQIPGTFRFFGGGGLGYDQDREDVTIVGVNRGGNWSVYAQTHPLGRGIGRVTKIFSQ